MDIFLQTYYGWILSFHIIAVMFWMAGLYYLPRLFVYHCQQLEDNKTGTIFSVMEQKLLHIIMTPAQIAAWFFGIMLVIHYTNNADWHLWLVLKLGLVVALSAYHGFLSAVHKRLRGALIPPYTSRFFRLINELPPLFTIIIVLLVILKPL
ncbi:MAG: CopD family protein [Alphaproteobacteria bacterium]|nr:CopD family protein [Alphaproteobacteria bacterium]